MKKVIEEFPKQFRAGINSAKNVKIGFRPKKLIICGMGGSALAGNILQIFLNDRKIFLPLHINRDYDLSFLPDKRALIIFISYSGNTEETLISFNALALKKDLSFIVIASGGKLAKLAKKNGLPLCEIPKGYQPRMTLGFQFGALARILYECKIIDCLDVVTSLEKTLKPGILEEKSKKISAKLKNKIPIIYASNRLKSLARIWKIKFNENSKIPAFFNYFPELNHNEMVGYTEKLKTTKNFEVIILKDAADGKNILGRMALTASIIRNKGIGVNFIELKGKNILEKVFSNLILSDWISYYLALGRKIDPTPVEIVESFKNKLKRRNNAQ